MSTKSPIVYFIVGEAQSGKTTTRNVISKKTGLKGGSCSDAIYAAWAKLAGIEVNDIRSRPKDGGLRRYLTAMGDWMTGHGEFPFDTFPEIDPANVQKMLEGGFERKRTALVDGLLDQGVFLIDGMRRPDEYDMSYRRICERGYMPVVMWVETSRHAGVKHDNFCLKIEDVRPDFIIRNDGTMVDLDEKVSSTLAGLGYFSGTIDAIRPIDPPVVIDVGPEPLSLACSGVDLSDPSLN